MIRLKLVVALALATMFYPSSFACESPQIDVDIRYSAPWVEYIPIASLNDKYRKKGDDTWLGSTSSRLQGEVLFYPGKPKDTYSSCTPAKMHIDLSFAEHEVTLAREIERLPCIHKTVRDHEEKHVALYKDMLSKMRPFVKSYAGRRVRQILDTTPQDSQLKAMQLFVSGELRLAIEQQWTALGERQKVLDTPQEYRRISATCPAEMATVDQLATELEAPKRHR